MQSENKYITIIGVIVMLVILCATACSVFADGSWGEIAAGGIQFKKNNDISIENEELYISQDKIKVSYSFKNHSDKDLNLLFVFPVPTYYFDVVDGLIPKYDDFSVWADGKKIKYKKEVRAFADGKDCTDTLRRMKITIENFGRSSDFIPELKGSDKRLLLKEKIIGKYFEKDDEDELWPLWGVNIKYYWTQKFPANGTVLIQHEYKPNIGGGILGYEKGFIVDESNHHIRSFECLGKETVEYLKAKKEKNPYVGAYDAVWVSYILKTANNWKQPIKDFHLIIDTKKDEVLGLCFDGEIKKTGPMRYESLLKNYSPAQDLTAVFIKTEGTK